MAGGAALSGVSACCSQYSTRSQILRHRAARVPFSLFAAVFFLPSPLAWTHALSVACVDFTCIASCAYAGAGTAIALGVLSGACVLLAGFLLVAQRPGPEPLTAEDAVGEKPRAREGVGARKGAALPFDARAPDFTVHGFGEPRPPGRTKN
jgi:hypothetical protein